MEILDPWDERGNLQRDTQDLDEASAERMRDFCKANPGLTLPELNRLDPRIWERGLLRGGV